MNIIMYVFACIVWTSTVVLLSYRIKIILNENVHKLLLVTIFTLHVFKLKHKLDNKADIKLSYALFTMSPMYVIIFL